MGNFTDLHFSDSDAVVSVSNLFLDDASVRLLLSDDILIPKLRQVAVLHHWVHLNLLFELAPLRSGRNVGSTSLCLVV